MATAAQWRKAALALPSSEEKSHFNQPDFRVRNKIFAGLSVDETQGNLKLPPEIQAVVLQESSGAFSPAAGAWGVSGWTRVDLARADIGLLQELLAEAWSIVAPTELVAARSGGARDTKPAKKTAAKKLPAKKTATKKVPAKNAATKRRNGAPR